MTEQPPTEQQLRKVVQELHEFARTHDGRITVQSPLLIMLCYAYLNPVCIHCGMADCECDEYD